MSKTNNDLQQIYDNASYLPYDYRLAMETYFNESPGSIAWKLQNFPKYVPRQSMTRFIVRYEIFKKILNIQGSIIEIGVLGGGSLMTWAQFSAIFEHLNYQRKVIGFDVFGDFPMASENDMTGHSIKMYEEGKMSLDSYNDIKNSIEVFNKNRFLSSIEKVHLVKGDVKITAPDFIKNNPETIVSLLYLDVNLYDPTKAAIEAFLPRMPKGSVIVFDELNDRGLPGETIALLETIDIKKLRIERFTYDTKISFAIID